VNVAAVVVLYRPGDDVFDCIESYSEQVKRIYLVDNSESPDSGRFRDYCQNRPVEYLALGDNYGIAKALNIGAERAIAAGFDFLLTMDQDSRAAPDMVKQMYAVGEKIGWQSISMLAPMHRIGWDHEKTTGEYFPVVTAWTSGCLVNLLAYRAIGPFEEKLFIDFVDHEYCLRSKKNGFQIVKVVNANLFHNIGENLRVVNILGKNIFITNHSVVRRYYITRNRFYVYLRYLRYSPGFCFFDFFRFFSEIITIIVFERDRIKKMKMISCGILDFLRGSYGKCRYV